MKLIVEHKLKKRLLELEIDIKTFLRPALDNGFTITESRYLGLRKYCKLEYPVLSMTIWKDRFDSTR